MRPEDRDLETVLPVRTSALRIQEYIAERTYQDYLAAYPACFAMGCMAVT